MKIRNEILKLAVNWEKREPSHWNVGDEWVEPVPGMRVRVVDWGGEDSPSAMITECEPGFHIPYHMHPDHDEHLTVVEGIAEVEVVKSLHTLSPGQSLVIPRGILHRGTYPEGAKIMIFFTE